jgi:membrane-bound lytic murein transglycosylase D
MKSKLLFGALCLLAYMPVQAQITADTVVIDSLEVAEAEEEMLYKEDANDYVYFALPNDLEYVPGDDDPDLFADRLQCIEERIPLVYNDKVHAFINYFTIKDRDYTKLMMRRKDLYFPLFEKYLAKYNLPDELKYLSIIESGLNPKAISRARAVGLWQFMSATGKYYGLHNDWYIDDRMDPEKATDAACRYLRDLYNMFNDWELALAAYNAGPGNVRRAIRKSDFKSRFWEIYPNLPRETRSYVPQFVAMIYTMHYLDEHNFIDEGSETMLAYDTLHTNQFIHLETFAKLSNTCIEDLQKLNPSIQRTALPANRKFTLRVPEEAKHHLMIPENRIAILDSASKVGRAEIEALAKNSDQIVYKVKSGDVLGSIALRHGVRVNDIKKWNNLTSNTIRVGQRLNIYTKSSSGASPKPSTSVVTTTQTSPSAIPDSKTYVVQPGDTLWAISRKFEGLTVEKIKSLNNLGDNKLQVGQKLKIGI